MNNPGTNRSEETPHTLMRRTIARRLTESKTQVPHFYIRADCAIDGLLSFRNRLNKEAQAQKVSVNDLVVRAVALALQEVPDANVNWEESCLRRFRCVDVAVAVATPRGLVTPIIRSAEAKPVRELASELKELAERGKAGRLKAEEYQGGAATVSNLGMFDVDGFTAIINPPQASIFAIGAGQQRPVVKDGKVAAATVMSVTISLDHRAMDGVTGARLANAFRRLLENPDALVA